MAETQSSSLSGTIHTEVIESLIIAYQYDDVVVTNLFRYKSIENETTTAAVFPRWVKSTGPTAGTPASEVTALATTEFTTTSVSISVSRVGIARELTTTAAEDSVVGRALYVQEFVMDAARLYGEYFDTTATDLFSTLSNEVGGTGTSLSIATMVSAVGRQRAGKCKGQLVISLHDNQLKQLQQAQASATSTPWQVFYAPTADGGQFGGYFMNAPIYASSLNETSTGDRLGAIWADGQGARPEFCAFGFVVKRLPSSLTQSNILMDSSIWASFSRVGFGAIASNFATAIRSVNA